jgi:hypothetical protein
MNADKVNRIATRAKSRAYGIIMALKRPSVSMRIEVTVKYIKARAESLGKM